MEDSTGMICIDSQFGGKIAPTPRWGLGANQMGSSYTYTHVHAHTHTERVYMYYVCIAAYFVVDCSRGIRTCTIA